MKMTAKFEAEGENFNTCFEQLNSAFNAEFSASGGGQDGKDGFSPVVAVDDIENGHRVTITDKEGTKTFDVMDGKDGTGGGGGANADWSVNDPEADGYVKNRPFYSYSETTVDTSTIASGTYTSQYLPDYGAFAAVVGIDSSAWLNGVLDFDVVFDGVEYKGLTMFTNEYLGGYFVGNMGILAPLFAANGLPAPDDTGESFCIWLLADDPITTALLVSDLTQSTTHDLSMVQVRETTEVKHVKIPTEYYDRGVGETYVGANGSNKMGEIFNDYANNIASGEYSHAEGSKTSANSYAHAEGRGAHAVGDCSHAEGENTYARGSWSHAEGNSTIANGNYSHAEGEDTRTNGEYSHAEGYQTVAQGAKQHVQGSCNIVDEDSKYLHIVGNGEYANSRSNAHTIDWDGLGWFSGGLKVGGTGQDDPEAEAILTESQVKALINDAIGVIENGSY